MYNLQTRKRKPKNSIKAERSLKTAVQRTITSAVKIENLCESLLSSSTHPHACYL